MELRYITEFTVLASCKSYSRASEELMISQPSLSKHIQTLEKELGGKLFDRNTHDISLSEMGQLFLPFATRISKEQQEYEAVLKSYKEKESSSFTIGVVHNLQYYYVTDYLIGFRSLYPECTINAVELEETQLENMLENKQLNLITAAIPSKADSPFPFIPVAEGHIVAVLSPSHPLANNKDVSIYSLSNENLIIPERTSMFSRFIRSTFKSAGIKPCIVYEGSSLGCFDFAKAGMGISLQAKEVVDAQQDPGICLLDVVPFISYRYGLMHRDTALLSPWEKKFVKYMQQYSILPS